MTSRRAALILPLAVAACAPDDAGRAQALLALQDILATCSVRSGEVQVKRASEGFWANAAVGTVFMAGDWVRSGPGAYARVELLGGGALELDENAEVILDAQQLAPDAGTTSDRAALV